MVKKIVCRLAGGLGNQLFEFGYAIHLARNNNIDSIFLDDYALQSYKTKYKSYLNSYFNFSSAPFQIKEQHNYITKLRLPKLFGWKKDKWPLIGDRNYKFIKNLRSCSILDGYFIWALDQSDFDKTRLELKKYLNSMQTRKFKRSECVVHIRGGDFIELGWQKFTPDSYYFDAMKTMVEEYDINYFIVITDDLKYTEGILNKCPYNFEIQSNDMKTDFYTIANSPKKIIGGSSFAIWASALGYDKNDGVLIAPKRDILLPNQIVD
jgi:hypothetical protein